MVTVTPVGTYEASLLVPATIGTANQSEQDAVFINSKEHRDSSLAARKVLADTPAQFKTIRQGRGSRRDHFEYQ
jgi:hypothetical protein